MEKLLELCSIAVVCAITTGCPAGTSINVGGDGVPSLEVGKPYRFYPSFPTGQNLQNYPEEGKIVSVGPGTWVKLDDDTLINTAVVWKIQPTQ